MVGIETRLHAEEPSVFVQLPAEAKYLSLLKSVQTGPEAYPDSFAMDIGTLSPGVKGPGRETNHKPSSNAEVKNECNYSLPRHITSWRVHR
jgi:hypothetical protein